MKKLVTIGIIILLIVPFNVLGKELILEDTTIFGGSNDDYVYQIKPTNDGGYIAVGSTASTDINGLTNKGSNDGLLIKYDSTNNIKWKITYGATDFESFNRVIETTSGDIIAVGVSTSTDLFASNGVKHRGGVTVKYDKDGNIIWQRSIGGNGIENVVSLTETTDKNYVIICESSSTDIPGITNKGQYDYIIIKYDKDGNTLWTKTYGGNKNEKLYSLVPTEDGGFVTVGKTESTDINNLTNNGLSDALILKYDKDGNLLYQQNYGGAGDDEFNNITKTIDGGYVVVGDYNSNKFLDLTNEGQLDSFIIKFDKDLQIKWQKNYGGNGYDIFEAVYEEADGSYTITGESTSTNLQGITNKGGFDGIIIEYDKNLDVRFQYNYGGDNLDVLGSYTKLQDKIILSGYTDSSSINSKQNNGKKDAFFIKASYKYNIETNTPENGTYELKNTNNKVEFEPKPDLGYKLDTITIKNHLNEDISVEEKNGIYYFDLTDDVTININFKKTLEINNPETGNINTIVDLIISLILVVGIIYKMRKNTKKNNI